MFAGHPKNIIASLKRLDRYDLGISLGVIFYSFIFSYITLVELTLFQLGRDVAIFNQAFWTTLYSGGILENSFEGVTHFGYHFSPILLSFLPFYLITPGPQLLLISQSILLGLGAVPIYICGRELLGKKAGLIVGLLYLLYPAVHGANLFAFHELAFLPLFLGIGLWGLITDRKEVCIISCILCLLIKEDVALLVGMIGLFGLLRTWQGQRRWEWKYGALILLSALILILYLFVMKPSFGLADTSDSAQLISQYSNPYANIHADLNQRIVFLFQMFLPLLFSPLLSPGFLLILIPSLIEILFSSPDIFVYYNVYSHYPLLITPVLFMGVILSLRKIAQCSSPGIKKLFYPLLILMTISSCTSAIMYSPVNSLGSTLFFQASPQFTEEQETLNALGSIIPSDASVSTQWQLLTLMSQRKNVWEGYHPDADVILIFPYFKGANIFDGNKSDIINNYDQVNQGKEIYLFVRKDEPDLKKKVSTGLDQFLIQKKNHVV